MAEPARQDQAHEDHLQALTDALESGTAQQIARMVNALHPAEIGHLLESLPVAERKVVWSLVSPDNAGEALLHVSDEVRPGLIEAMEADELVAAVGAMDMDDLADILQDLPGAVTEEVLRAMDLQNRQRLQAVLSYPEDSAGGLMNIDTVTVRADVTLDVVLRYLRLRGEIPELTDSLIVVNRYDRYMGLLALSDLLTHEPSLTVAEVMGRDVEAIPATMTAREVAKRFEDRDLISAPVVDEDGRLLGRITIDDVVDVIREDAEHSLMSMAGLTEEEDMFAPVLHAARRRAIWLGVNLVTAFVAAWVIGRFEATLDQIVALAVLMPIVASMGGIAGSQTLTLVIRGMALGQLGSANTRWLLVKEVAVGLLNGLVWALVVAGVAVAWFDSPPIGVIIAAAMVINLLCAALAGVSVPLILRKLRIDPALAGTVVLTTVTDVVGFMAFLGLATAFLL
ncbi:MAG: magnesium transporter [Gammaproteobacteria bacterium]|nr:magnesium transporter [Gammaproteobacteria bacterium]NIR82885.1 magnesium transporter [Gammaproteobacteria bacterium]NIR89997.1 magnesium transporter [Gammaproteobacteria bacterium]NIU03477.1 magnesium transporter [Gammaproteobacteria bacterium]NIV50996.1 magnesium transporter [Gammaproteobacteria bacterium]